MKRLEISRLMDEYQDNEFFPEDGSAADVRAVKGRVLAQAANQRKQMPGMKKVLVAAALAAAMVLLVGAGFPSIVYYLSNGTVTFFQTSNSKYSSIESSGDPLIDLEDGRLMSLLNGERTDITDLVSESKPYIFDCSDLNDGTTYYVIMGGTPEHYGSFQWIVTPDPFTYNDGDPIHDGTEAGIMYSYSYESYRKEDLEKDEYYIDKDGQRQISEGGEPYISRSSCLGSGIITITDHQIGRSEVPSWLLSAMDELDIPYQYTSSEDITVLHH